MHMKSLVNPSRQTTNVYTLGTYDASAIAQNISLHLFREKRPLDTYLKKNTSLI